MNHRVAAFRFVGPLLLLAACNPNEPWVPSLRHEMTTDDYAVYSAWLVSQAQGNRPVLVDAWTLGYLGLSLTDGLSQHNVYSVPVPADAPEIASPLTGARAEALQDFAVQEALSLPLARRLEGARYELVSDPIPSDLLAGGRAAIDFSRVGFDRHFQVATFRVAQATRDEFDWGWFRPVVRYEVWAEKRSWGWELVEVRQVWRSGPLIGQPPESTGTIAIQGLVAPVRPCRVARLGGTQFCPPRVSTWP